MRLANQTGQIVYLGRANLLWQHDQRGRWPAASPGADILSTRFSAKVPLKPTSRALSASLAVCHSESANLVRSPVAGSRRLSYLTDSRLTGDGRHRHRVVIRPSGHSCSTAHRKPSRPRYGGEGATLRFPSSSARSCRLGALKQASGSHRNCGRVGWTASRSLRRWYRLTGEPRPTVRICSVIH